ncbi:MAG: hypothetical protein HY052_01120 [Proteobacteria bacterium]|nr:hypothetical protein [Pseudomonadota bacterium]
MVTFVSALVFQSIYVAISLPRSFRHSEETLNADLEREKSFEQYATIGDVSFDLQEPYSDKRGINGELVELSLFRHLAIIVPISVTHPGVYQIYLQYHDNTVGGNNEFEKEVTQDLHIGSNMLRIEFPWNESRGFGYASPKIAKGGARIQLSYLASPQELFGNLKPGSSVERNILQKFMKERGFDKGLSSTSHINQFVSQKQVQF